MASSKHKFCKKAAHPHLVLHDFLRFLLTDALFCRRMQRNVIFLTRPTVECRKKPRQLRSVLVKQVYCKGKIRTTPFAVSFGRFAVHRLCNTWVLLHPLRGRSSQNLTAKGAKQSKAVYFAVSRGERRRACRVARASLSTMDHRKIDAFDRVRIAPLQYTICSKRAHASFVNLTAILCCFFIRFSFARLL